jgi:hypothetical protein
MLAHGFENINKILFIEKLLVADGWQVATGKNNKTTPVASRHPRRNSSLQQCRVRYLHYLLIVIMAERPNMMRKVDAGQQPVNS